METKKGSDSTLKISDVQLKIVGEDLSVVKAYKELLELKISCMAGSACEISFHDGTVEVFKGIVNTILKNIYQAGQNVVQVKVTQGSAVITTKTSDDTNQLLDCLHSHVAMGDLAKEQSVFALRTDDASSEQYFAWYSSFAMQQSMLKDFVRTSTYQSAMLQNAKDFEGKVVLDIGAGSGILSFFAVQAGAKKVYAIEGSNMAIHCAKLVSANNLSDKIILVPGKVEEVSIPEKIDMLISEPMGYMLYNERMIETFLHAKKWLKPDGKMFPTKGLLYVAPFSDEGIYQEQISKSTFWTQTSFHGVDLSALADTVQTEYLGQPIKDTFDDRILMANPVVHTTNFLTVDETELHKIVIPLSFTLKSPGIMHGLAFWFDVAFCGSQQTVWLSTAPNQPLTHWYQIRCLFTSPVMGKTGQVVTGTVTMAVNLKQSYDIDFKGEVQGTDLKFSGFSDLKNPYFRYMAAPQVPPGKQYVNPTLSSFGSSADTAEKNGVLKNPLGEGMATASSPYYMVSC